MRKWIAILVAAILLLGLVGCDFLSASEPEEQEPIVLNAGNNSAEIELPQQIQPTDYNTWKQYILAMFEGYDITFEDNSNIYTYTIKFSGVGDYDAWLEIWAEITENFAYYNRNGMHEMRNIEVDSGSVRFYINADPANDYKVETWVIVVANKSYDIELKYLTLFKEYDMYYSNRLDSIYSVDWDELEEAEQQTQDEQ